VAWDALSDSVVSAATSNGGLTPTRLMLVHSLRLLLTSQIHALPTLPFLALQLSALGGVLFRATDACLTWPAFVHPASVRVFNAAARRLEQYSSVVSSSIALMQPAHVHALVTGGSNGSTGGDSGNSYCVPVIMWFEVILTLLLPLGYQLLTELRARRRYLAHHCYCPRCSDAGAGNPRGITLVVLLALHGPALVWHFILRVWLRTASPALA